MPLSDGALLTLEHVGRQHAGTYQCKAENGVRTPVYAEVTLKVLCKFHPHLNSHTFKSFT